MVHIKNEKSLIQKLQRQDKKAFSKLMEAYTSYVSSVIYAVSRGQMPREDIEETAADVFVEIWKRPEKLREGKLKPYLGSVARNLTLSRLRKQGREFPVSDEDMMITDNSFADEINSMELSEIINEALCELSSSERDIFIRYYWFCHTSAEISESLKIPVSTITTTLSRGRKKLKEKLEERGL